MSIDATNPLCRQANNASAPPSGKEGDDSVSPARSGERNERTTAQGSWSIGRYRSGLPEGVCDKAVAAQRPGDVADTVERSECGVAEEYRLGSWHNILFRVPTGYCSYCRAVVRRAGRNGECGEIASSPSGGRVKDEHSPKAKRPILTDKSPETLLSTFIYEEKEYECHSNNNQNDAAVRRLINC